MKEYLNLITRPEDISDKDYAALMWTEMAVLLLLIFWSRADVWECAFLVFNAVASIAYCIKFIDWSKVKE